MKGRFSLSLSSFHSAPSLLEISELCILGFSWAIFRRCPRDHTMNAFMGRFICSLCSVFDDISTATLPIFYDPLIDPSYLYLITIFHRCHRFASFRTISHFVLVHRHRILVQSIMYPDEYRSTHLLLPSPSVQRSITWPVKVNNLHTPQRPPSLHDPSQSWERTNDSRRVSNSRSTFLSPPSRRNSLGKIHSPLPFKTHTKYIINLPIILLIPRQPHSQSSIILQRQFSASLEPFPNGISFFLPSSILRFRENSQFQPVAVQHTDGWKRSADEGHRSDTRGEKLCDWYRDEDWQGSVRTLSDVESGTRQGGIGSPAGDAGRQGSANQGCFSSPTTSHG